MSFYFYNLNSFCLTFGQPVFSMSFSFFILPPYTVKNQPVVKNDALRNCNGLLKTVEDCALYLFLSVTSLSEV